MKRKLILFFVFVFSILFINVNAYEINKNDKLYVSGQSIGIKLNSGVEVVGTYGIKKDKKIYKPWDECGLQEGDKILNLNNIEIETTDDLLDVLRKSGGNEMLIKWMRGIKEFSGSIKPVKNEDSYSLGLFIKDSILGVGTLTYYVKEANIFGSLGHKISSSDHNSGQIYEASVTEIIKPSNSQAGEKRATVTGEAIGDISKNTITGVHGTANKNIDISDMEYLNFKTKEDINLGDAEIWTCVDGLNIEKFDIKITNLEKQNKKDIKGITFEVVDADLISKSGGIVQGMSGSPIVQDDKLVGAVTHVSVKNAKLAYGIYLEWMFEDMGIKVVK